MTNGDVQTAPQNRGATLRGKPGHSDELLGWHGSDHLYGGDDFIYSARGRNTIYGGPGNDAIKARYGRGVVNCGPGRDIVHVPRSRRNNWTFKNCEKYEFRSEAVTGHGLKPLP